MASLPKTSSCRELSDSASSSSSRCSVSDLTHLTNQYRATGRIRRELRGQPEGSSGQTSLKVLTDSLEKNLNNLELFPSEHSIPVPVITYTPSRRPPTSTPSNSPTDPPLPPRGCQSLGVRPLPNQTHSSVCSELSTIDTVGPEEVFSDSEVHDDSPRRMG